MTGARRGSVTVGKRRASAAGFLPIARYRFVDFAADAQPGFRNHIVPVDEVSECVSRYGASECYATNFFFAEDARDYLHSHRVNGRPSLAGFDGRVWAPFLPIDIDAHPPEAGLEDALRVARQTYHLLVDGWLAPAAAVHVYFSGAKGFHVLVDSRAFGRVLPSKDLHRIFWEIRLQILPALPPQAHEFLDLAIGDTLRLLRLPNTRHAGSGLFKIALSPEELMAGSAAKILEKARAPRPLDRVSAAGLLSRHRVGVVPALAQAYARARRAICAPRGEILSPPDLPRLGPREVRCAALLAERQASSKPANGIGVATRLASAIRQAGHGREEALELLISWNRRQHLGLLEEELRAVVQSAYSSRHQTSCG